MLFLPLFPSLLTFVSRIAAPLRRPAPRTHAPLQGLLVRLG